MAKDTAGIGEAIRMLRSCGIEKNTDGLLRLRAENDNAGVDFAGLPRVAVNVENAAGAIAIRIHQNFVDHGVRYEGALASV